jgi:hypothetical protein
MIDSIIYFYHIDYSLLASDVFFSLAKTVRFETLFPRPSNKLFQAAAYEKCDASTALTKAGTQLSLLAIGELICTNSYCESSCNSIGVKANTWNPSIIPFFWKACMKVGV